MTPEQRAWRRQGKARCIARVRALLGPAPDPRRNPNPAPDGPPPISQTRPKGPCPHCGRET